MLGVFVLIILYVMPSICIGSWIGAQTNKVDQHVCLLAIA